MAEDADALLLPSMHDDAPVVVVEALASGLPVVCLDRGGPPILGGLAITPDGPRRTAEALARAVLAAHAPGGNVPRVSTQAVRLTRLLNESGLLATDLPAGASGVRKTG
jgi:glycosyltransferase involved in cell wall biosynthesis